MGMGLFFWAHFLLFLWAGPFPYFWPSPPPSLHLPTAHLLHFSYPPLLLLHILFII